MAMAVLPPRFQALLCAALLQASAPRSAALHTRLSERSSSSAKATAADGGGDGMVRVTFELPTSTVRIEVDSAAGTVTLDGWPPESGHRPRVPVVALRRKSEAEVWQDQSEQGGSEEIIARATAFVGETLGRDGFLGHAVVSARNPRCLDPGQVAEARWTQENRTYHSSGVLVNGTFMRAEDNKTFHCVGRCGKGCPDPSKPHSRNIFTQACLNHDFCLISQVDNDCGDELVKSLGDYIMGWQDCADTGPFDTVGGHDENLELPGSKWKANVRKALSIAKESMQGAEAKARDAKWNDTSAAPLGGNGTANGTGGLDGGVKGRYAAAAKRSKLQLTPSEMDAYRAFLAKLIAEEEEERNQRRQAVLDSRALFLQDRSIDLPGMIPENMSDLAMSHQDEAAASAVTRGTAPAKAKKANSQQRPFAPVQAEKKEEAAEAAELWNAIPEGLSADATTEEAAATEAAAAEASEGAAAAATSLLQVEAFKEVPAAKAAAGGERAGKPKSYNALAPAEDLEAEAQTTTPPGAAAAVSPAAGHLSPALGHVDSHAKAAGAAPKQRQGGKEAAPKAKPASGRHAGAPTQVAASAPKGTVVNTLQEADDADASTTEAPARKPQAGAHAASSPHAKAKAGAPGAKAAANPHAKAKPPAAGAHAKTAGKKGPLVAHPPGQAKASVAGGGNAKAAAKKGPQAPATGANAKAATKTGHPVAHPNGQTKALAAGENAKAAGKKGFQAPAAGANAKAAAKKGPLAAHPPGHDAKAAAAGAAGAPVPAAAARISRKAAAGEVAARASAEAGVVDVDPAAEDEAPTGARTSRSAWRAKVADDPVLHEPFDSGLTLHEPAPVEAGDDDVLAVDVGARRGSKAEALNIAVNASKLNATKSKVQALKVSIINSSRHNSTTWKVQTLKVAVNVTAHNASASKVAVNASTHTATTSKVQALKVAVVNGSRHNSTTWKVEALSIAVNGSRSNASRPKAPAPKVAASGGGGGGAQNATKPKALRIAINEILRNASKPKVHTQASVVSGNTINATKAKVQALNIEVNASTSNATKPKVSPFLNVAVNVSKRAPSRSEADSDRKMDAPHQK